MKLNENTVIKGNLVILVPYEKCHVPKYHEWMKSEELQILTASEPLTLEEEYNMQKSWRTDPDIKYFYNKINNYTIAAKCSNLFSINTVNTYFLTFVTECTFIVLDKRKYDLSKISTEAMVGDTNIFLKTVDNIILGEIEIMIAEKSARGKGLGKEAVLLMLRYGIENLNINIFEAKVGMQNHASLSLFMKIGFEKTEENKIFNEITLQKEITHSWTQWLISETKNYIKEKHTIQK